MLPLALTMGDPAGIGPDITLRAWLARRERQVPAFAVIGDSDVLRGRAALCGLSVSVVEVDDFCAVDEVFSSALPVVSHNCAKKVEAGIADGGNAGAICGSIRAGVDAIYNGQASAIVTNPINKAVLYGAGFEYPGHTEFLGSLAEARGDEARPVMMLTGLGLRVVPATIHIPLKDVPSAISSDLIVSVLDVMTRDLTLRFGLETPHVAVTGLNPHAGEDGRIGNEDRDIIVPAIKRAQAAGYDVSGPYPADTIFHEKARARYDAVLAMYHDQALIPLKTLAFDRGVNVTLGLPFIRTSPDHGTAYDLAGSDEVNPLSLIEALCLAGEMVQAGARTRSQVKG